MCVWKPAPASTALCARRARAASRRESGASTGDALSGPDGSVMGLDLEELCLFALERLVDRVDVRLGQRIQLLLRTSQLVLADVVLERIELVLGLAPDAAHVPLGVLALGAHELHELLAAFG